MPARADDIDSEHMFGFTEGSDIGEKGERELELSSAGRFGKRGSYGALSNAAEAKISITDDFRIAPGASFSYHNIRNVPGLANTSGLAFEGLSFEVKYRLLNRAHAPFGLTVSALAGAGRIDETAGVRTRDYGVGFAILADKELVSGKLFGAVNLTYDAGVNRHFNVAGWTQASGVGVSAALSARVSDPLFVGAEARYARAASGYGLNGALGQAFFVGPTFVYKLSDTTFIAGGWNIQVAGREYGVPGRRDLTNFSAHETRLRFGMRF